MRTLYIITPIVIFSIILASALILYTQDPTYQNGQTDTESFITGQSCKANSQCKYIKCIEKSEQTAEWDKFRCANVQETVMNWECKDILVDTSVECQCGLENSTNESFCIRKN